jgi:hypothetical protein
MRRNGRTAELGDGTWQDPYMYEMWPGTGKGGVKRFLEAREIVADSRLCITSGSGYLGEVDAGRHGLLAAG